MASLNSRSAAFVGFVEVFVGKAPAANLARVLTLHPDDLNAHGAAAVASTEQPLATAIQLLASGIRAYQQFQDLMEQELTDDPNEGRHYCYYESIAYLREAAVTVLNGNVLASLTLARPLLELSIYHVHWRVKGRGSSYSAFYKWLNQDGGKPPFKNTLEMIVAALSSEMGDQAPRLQVLLNDLFGMYKESCAYNHTPRPEESLVTLNRGTGPNDQAAVLFGLRTLNDRIRQLVLLMIAAHPMALFPVDMTRKWGYTGPVGIFCRESAYQILVEYLGPVVVERMRALYESHPDVQTKLEWYAAHPDLDAEGLEQTWRDVAVLDSSLLNISDRVHRIASAQANLRAITWMFSYHLPRGEHASQPPTKWTDNW